MNTMSPGAPSAWRDGGVRVGDTIEAGDGPFYMTLAVEFVGNSIMIQLPYSLKAKSMWSATSGWRWRLTSGIHRVAIRDVEVALEAGTSMRATCWRTFEAWYSVLSR